MPDSQPAPKSAQTGPDPTATISPAQQSIETSLAGAPTRVPGAAAKASPFPLPAAFGRYQIEKELGKGAMGVVYLAEDTQLHRKVALKIPKQSVLEEPETLERFYREARTTATLRHNNICPVYDVGQIDGTHYLAMAYIPGKPVSSYLGKKLPPAKQVALLIRKIALALEEAHRNGVVHRDLKPSNVMLDDRGEPIVMDFGLACQLNTERNARITQSGAILGTPAYMSPEQVRGEIDNIGPRSDIYALGVMLYQFLTGELPFSGPIMLVFAQIIGQQPKKPSEVKPDIDPALEAICLKMMAKDANQRYASMKEAAAALSEYLKGGMVSTATPAVPVPLLQEPEPAPGIESLLELPTLRTIERTRRTTKPAKAPATSDAVHWRVRKYWPVPGLLVLGAIALFGVTIYFKNTKTKVRDESNVKLEGNKITASGPNGSNPVEITFNEQPGDGVAVTDEPLDFFNHKDLASWQQLKRAANGSDEIVPVADWTVTSDGTLKSLGQTNGLLRYNREFGSFELSCQVKLTDDANTGIFVLLPQTVGVPNPGSGFEVQLATKYHPAALIGAQGAGTGHAAKFRPVGEWNDLVVRFEAGKSLTASVNGELASDLDLKEPAYAQTPARGYVALQAMQNISTDCEFRNLRVRELKPAQDTGTPTNTSQSQTAQDNAAGTDLLADGDFQPLFNGRDLTGWQTDAANRSVWTVVGDQIIGTGNGTEKPQNVNPLLTERRDFHNFHLRTELKLDAGNSGLFFLVPDRELNPGYEAELGLVYQDGPFYRLGSVIADDNHGQTRAVKVTMPPKIEHGEWFTLEVLVQDNKITTLVNGTNVIEWRDSGRHVANGRIGLANFSPNAKIAIRKLEIRELPDTTKTAPPEEAAKHPDNGPSLLSRIELPRDRVLGDWSLENGTLISRGTPLPKLPRVQIPVTPPDAYRWEFDVEQDGSECVNLGLIVGGVQTILAVDEFPKLGHRTGLSQVDGKSALQNMSAVKGRQLPPRRNTIACVVQPADGGAYVVTLSINSKAVYQWSGKPQQLSLHDGWKVPRSDQLFLGGSSIGYRISRMELTPLEPKASSLPRVVKPSKPDHDGWIDLIGDDFPKRWEHYGLRGQGNYRLVDGVLQKESELDRGIMAHDTKFTNFVLQLDYRLSAVDDIARIYFRLHPSGNRPPSQALAVQLIDNRSSHSGGPNRTAKISNGALYQLAGPELPVNLPHGEWHSLEVRAVGPKITIKFNRRVVLDGSLKQIPELAADSEALNESGVIGVQYFKGHAEVRNLRVQPLDGKGKPVKE